MAHMITGIVFISIALLLFIIDRYFTYIDFMSSFTERSFKRLVGGFSIIGVLLFGFGVYSYVTYAPPFIQIEVSGEGYFVDGDIGDVAYIQNETKIYRAGVETNLLFVAWEKINTKDLTVHLKDEAGTENIFPDELELINNKFTSSVHEKLETECVFELSPFVFETAGNWTITIKENAKKIASFQIRVYE